MVSLGYALLCEEHEPNELVDNALKAEEAGFEFAVISDHYHPWTNTQGQSAFVWSVLGALASRTERLTLGTAVTCPTMRIHPAIIAQAAATVTAMAPGRFFLGVGTGERLNEHILGDPWPAPAIRLEMLEEAIDVMRRLWTGDLVTYQGGYYTVDRARIYTRPPAPPPVLVAASGPSSGRLAARAGDGVIATKPNRKLVELIDGEGNGSRPKVGMLHGCYAESEEEGWRTFKEQWPNSALGGNLGQELALPDDYEAATQHVTEEAFRGLPCGPDPEVHAQAVREFIDAGYDHIFVHQIGHRQAEFIDFYRREVMPRLDTQPAHIVQAA